MVLTRRRSKEQLRLLELRDAVALAPDNVPLHLVYADALLEAGDELGQLIMQQVQTPDLEPGELMLDRLAGPIARYAATLDVRLGVLRRVELRSINATILSRLAKRTEWRGVEALALPLAVGRHGLRSTMSAEPLVNFFRWADFGCLRELSGLNPAWFCALLREPLRLRRVGVVGAFSDVAFPIKTPRLSFTELDTTMTFGAMPWLCAAGRAVYERLEVLVCAEGSPELQVLIDPPPGLRRFQGTMLNLTKAASGDTWSLAVRLGGGPGYPPVGRARETFEAAVSKSKLRFSEVKIGTWEPDLDAQRTGLQRLMGGCRVQLIYDSTIENDDAPF